ncbi:MAG TPA: adenylosuccinate synthase [Sedimentisphaerales bacterium]|nr:adenylosuccinate synthase [Sedimentisphaerales bacterium]
MNTCVVGLQWGDEGKGKVVDILAERSEVVVRYGGGANAGHTVVIADNRFALHLLPSGAIREGILCVIANAVVVDPSVLIDEIDGLAQRGISLAGRLFISENAHVVLDYHKREDQLREESLGKAKIGTTIRGIGPCYADKVGRSYAVRMSDLRDLKALSEKLRMILAYKNKLFGALYGAEPMDVEVVIENCRRYADRLVPYTTDTTELLHAVIGEGKSVLFEGAQGSLLDLDHGTFPYVTSSNSSSLGLPSGCGVPARMVDKYIGVAKAYTTRVGAGPFPTEQDNAIGEYIRVKGHEYGTTTGRPRRCGWFDGVAAAYSIRIGSVDSVALMHLDTLTGIQELQVCRAYSIDGKETTFFPSNIDRLARAKPVYETLSGWDEDLGNATSFASLPVAAQRYVRRIEQILGKPVEMIGVGPKRSQTILK